MTIGSSLNKGMIEKSLPIEIRNYITNFGFRKTAEISGKASIYQLPDNPEYELLLPLDPSLADYTNRVRDILVTLSSLTKKDMQNILAEILQPPSDIVKFSVSSFSTEKGTISLSEGISLLKSAERAILASACQVIDPQRYHRRLQRADAEAFMEACRMGQTEFGSYVVTVSCPLNATTTEVDENRSVSSRDVPPAIPFTRNVTQGLMNSVQGIVRAIDDDNISALTSTANTSIIASANLCDALISMQPRETNGVLTITTDWTKSLPPISGVPAFVKIRKDYFDPIEQIGRQLRPEVTPRQETFLGKVEKLLGNPGEDGRTQGDVELACFPKEDGGELLRARVALQPEDYAKACDAHRDGSIVRLKGTLHQSGRVGKIKDYSDFVPVPNG